MANIKIELGHTIINGQPLSFKAPCDCTAVTGIKVDYPDGESITSTVFSFADAHGNELAGIGNLFAADAMVKVILDTGAKKAYIQNADTNSYIEGTFVKKNPPVLTATPDTLADVMASAQAGATIQLTAGQYPLLTFTGEYGLARAETDNPLPGIVLKYPEGLTIVGGDGVKVAGISITSGQFGRPAYITSNNDMLELPSNLTIKDLTVEGSICLRNCSIDGLNILNCKVTNGNIQLMPTSLVDKYGRDTTGTAPTAWHYPSAQPFIRNVTIDSNYISAYDSDDTNITAILVNCFHNLEITNNEINTAEWNGIQVTGRGANYSTGRIAILKNFIRTSGSRGINIANLKNAELFVHSNNMRAANTLPDESNNPEYIIVSNCENTTYTWTLGTGGINTYRDTIDDPMKSLSVGDGITLEQCFNEASYVVEEDYTNIWRGQWRYRRWSNGTVELIGSVLLEVDYTHWANVDLPLLIPQTSNPHIQITVNNGLKYYLYPTIPLRYEFTDNYMENKTYDAIDIWFDNAPDNESVEVTINMHIIYKAERIEINE